MISQTRLAASGCTYHAVYPLGRADADHDSILVFCVSNWQKLYEIMRTSSFSGYISRDLTSTSASADTCSLHILAIKSPSFGLHVIASARMYSVVSSLVLLTQTIAAYWWFLARIKPKIGWNSNVPRRFSTYVSRFSSLVLLTDGFNNEKKCLGIWLILMLHQNVD